MTSANNTAPEQKIDADQQKEKEAEKDKEELLMWPPANFKDTFTAPKFYKLILKNHLMNAVCFINSAESYEKANDPAIEPVKNIAVFFSHKFDATPPPPDNPNHGDWMMLPIPDNPGSAKHLLIHQKTVEYIAQTREKFRDCRLIMHPVPHPTQHGVFSVSEIYIMPRGVEGTGAPKTQVCLYCQKPSAKGVCKCESVYFCTTMCRERAVQNRLHTEETCTTLMRKPIMNTMADVRRLFIEYHTAIKENEASASKATKQHEAAKLEEEKRSQKETETELAKQAEKKRLFEEAEALAARRDALSEVKIVEPDVSKK
jgi:hypothetical protein